MLLKACWGGQSLAVDFRSPSAGKWDKPVEQLHDGVSWKPGSTGWAYKQIFIEQHLAGLVAGVVLGALMSKPKPAPATLPDSSTGSS